MIRSDKSIISIALVGELITHKPVLRSGSRVHDLLMATGPLGLSSAGLEILENRREPLNPDEQFLLKRHLYPEPRLKEGTVLGDVDRLATSMLDLSDDLMTSLEILRRDGGVGFEISLDGIPVHAALRKFCERGKFPTHRFILWGGEDYELLFTVPSSKAARVKRKIPRSYVLGRVMPKAFGIKILRNGKRFFPRDLRFKHFQ